MNRLVKNGLLAVTVLGTLTLGACATDGYYSSSTGYSTYPYSRPYVYPSGSVSFYYSSPRYYRYGRGYYPRRYYGGRYYRHHGRHYHHRPGYRPPHGHHRPNHRPGRPSHRPGRPSHRPGRPSHHGRAHRGRSHR